MTVTPRIGVLGIPGAWSSERLAEAAERTTGERILADPDDLSVDVESGRVRASGIDLTGLDALLVKKIGREYRPEHRERLEILRFLDHRDGTVAPNGGTRVFSRPGSIAAAMDRLTCTLTLRGHGLPLPRTVVTEDPEEAMAAVRRFGRAVLKPLYTSKARGMRPVEDGPDLEDEIRSFHREGRRVLYVQEFVDHPGWDLGMIFLDGDHLGTYRRVTTDETWTTAVSDSGKYEAFDPDEELVDLGRRAQAPFGLTITSVDVALPEAGPVIWEVSAFGGFRGLWETAGIDAAEAWVTHVQETLADE